MPDLLGRPKTLSSRGTTRRRRSLLLLAVRQDVAVISGARRDMGVSTILTGNQPAPHDSIE